MQIARLRVVDSRVVLDRIGRAAVKWWGDRPLPFDAAGVETRPAPFTLIRVTGPRPTFRLLGLAAVVAGLGFFGGPRK